MSDRRPTDTPPAPVVLLPTTDPDSGEVVYARTAEPAEDPVPPDEDPTVVMPAPPPVVLSALPRERMAAGDNWATIMETLRAQESGRRTPTDIVVEPGGRLTQVSAERVEESFSKLPPERMAAVNVGPSSADAAEISALDPANVECWTPVWHEDFGGWTFEMTPPIHGQRRFKFLVFRSPSDGNALRISPLYPDLDSQYGHEPHMITARMGGEDVPVICGPAGRAARTFADARGDAAKWMVYTSYRMAGLRPPFSE
ncbi:MAG: hypothetical protein AB7J32_19020 [Pseudonocardia sp.]